MFQALLSHLQEELHKWNFVYCMCVMSGVCSNPGAVLSSICVALTICIAANCSRSFVY
jgi:hypothetical protein